MSNGAAIYWEPRGAGSMRKISLGGISHFDPIPLTARNDVPTYGGRVYRQPVYTGLRVRVGIEAFAAGDAERKLATVIAHMSKGGSIGFALDDSKAWCGYLPKQPGVDETSIWTGGNVWHGANDSTLASGDELAVESVDTLFSHEVVESSGSVTSTARRVNVNAPGVQLEHTGVGWVRHRGYLPLAHWPAEFLGTPPLSSKHRRVFRYDMVLQLDIAGLAALYAKSDAPFSLGDLPGGGFQAIGAMPSLTDLLNPAVQETDPGPYVTPKPILGKRRGWP